MSVGEQINQGDMWSAGIAYIIIPFDIDRGIYINECYRTSRISIQMEDGCVVHRVPISLDILNFIDFPLKQAELGTAVVFITEPKHKQPIVVTRLQKSDQLGDGRENNFHIKRLFKDRLVSISGDVDAGSLDITVNGGEKIGKLNISLDNDANNCVFELEVSGKIDIKASDSTIIQNHNEFKSIISDIDEQQAKPSVISQTRKRTLVGNAEVLINGEEITAIHYKGYRIAINDKGIQIDSLNKDVVIECGSNKVQLTPKGVFIEGDKVNIQGGFEALYNTIPGAPIANLSQIGVSKKVSIG